MTAERGEAEVLAQQLQDSLGEVAHALGQAGDGEYGTCEACGEPIATGPPGSDAGRPVLHQPRLAALSDRRSMGFGGAGRSSGARPGQGFTRGQQTAMIVAVGVALVVILLLTHRITRFEIIYFVVLIPSIILHEISHGVVGLWLRGRHRQAGRTAVAQPHQATSTRWAPCWSRPSSACRAWAPTAGPSRCRSATNRLRSPRNQTVLVSLIGPVTNFALAAAFGVAFALTTPLAVRETVHQFGLGQYPDGSYDIPTLLGQVLFIAGFANIVLGVFNLIPCPPLDGASVLERFIPARYLPEYYRLTPVLMFLPFVLIFFFRSEWAALINHVITWWSGLLV